MTPAQNLDEIHNYKVKIYILNKIHNSKLKVARMRINLNEMQRLSWFISRRSEVLTIILMCI
jgi:hypothetical protein